MSLNILNPLKEIWKEVKQKIKEGESGIRPFWSEADLVHFIATHFQDILHKWASKDFIVHVSSSFIPDSTLFGSLAPKLGEFLKEYNRKIGKKQAKVIPDLIVHRAGDATHLQLCAEVKLFLGTNWWNNKLEGVKKDLQEISMLEHKHICDKVAMLVDFDPQPEKPKQHDDLKSILDDWQRKEPNLLILRYNC